eukprot:3383827-Pleurochrysis_carterae.AAC.1
MPEVDLCKETPHELPSARAVSPCDPDSLPVAHSRSVLLLKFFSLAPPLPLRPSLPLFKSSPLLTSLPPFSLPLPLPFSLSARPHLRVAAHQARELAALGSE